MRFLKSRQMGYVLWSYCLALGILAAMICSGLSLYHRYRINEVLESVATIENNIMHALIVYYMLNKDSPKNLESVSLSGLFNQGLLNYGFNHSYVSDVNLRYTKAKNSKFYAQAEISAKLMNIPESRSQVINVLSSGLESVKQSGANTYVVKWSEPLSFFSNHMTQQF
ncbi:MAG: hypothetical protein ACRY3E_00110 [Candidatus Lariskella arthropodorum]